MRIIPLWLLICLLTACAGPGLKEAVQQCPPIGIDLAHPDFKEPYSQSDTDPYYQCLLQNIPAQSGFSKFMAGRSANGSMLFGSTNDQDSQALRLQASLWNMIQTGQTTPEKAQIAWLTWQTNTQQAMAQLAAQRRANSDAFVANNQAIANQQWQTMQMNRPVTCMGGGGGVTTCQ